MMTGLVFISTGAFLGLSIAAPVGPMSVLCMKRTLAHGMGIGITTGAGATTVQLCYGALLLLGLDQIEPLLTCYRQLLSLIGAALMLAFAWRLLWVRQSTAPTRLSRPRSAMFAYITAVAFNCINPMGIVLLAAGMTSLFGPAPPSGSDGAWMLIGLGVGSFGWWIGLTGLTTILGRGLSGGGFAVINQLTATVLTGFSLLTLTRMISH